MIFVECNPDVVLARIVSGLPPREVAHAGGGKGRVLNKVLRAQGAKGLVDEDPGKIQPGTLERFVLVEDWPEGSLRRLSDPASSNQVVVLRPALEEWIIATAREAGKDMRGFNLPNEPHELHHVVTLQPKKLTLPLEALLGARSQRLQRLRDWLR